MKRSGYRTPTAVPTAKVVAASVAALLAPILIGLLAKAFPDVPLPADANDLAQQVVQGLVLGTSVFVAGWLKSPAERDAPVSKD